MLGAVTALTIVAGLMFSVACAILLEEMIFGGLFRLFFAPRPVDPGNQRSSGRQEK
jgi:hypothetical protein